MTVSCGAYPGQTLEDLKDPALVSFIDMARWMAGNYQPADVVAFWTARKIAGG